MTRLLHTKPAYLICAILGLELVLSIFVLPQLLSVNDRLYSFGFVDDYDKLGFMLSQGHGYRFTPQTGLTLMREPGYPLLLAGLFRLFGYGLLPVRLANIAFAGLSAWIVSWLAGRLSTERAVALFAVLLFLINPGVIVAELRGGVEMLFIFLEVSFVALLYRAVANGSLRLYFAAGLVLGLASSVRSTALLFPVFLPVYFIFWESPRPAYMRMATRLIVLAAGATLVLSPWMIRNYLLVGVPIPSASVQGIAADVGLYMCKNISADSDLLAMDTNSAEIRAELAFRQGYVFERDYYLYFYKPQDEVAFNNFLGKQVLDEYRRDPGLLGKCAALNSLLFWFGGKTWLASLYNLAAQLPYMVAAIVGAIAVARRGRIRTIGLLILFCLYTILVYVPIHAQARYSIPLIPFLSLLIAAGLIPQTGARALPVSA